MGNLQVGVSVAWIPIISNFNSSQLFVYIQVSPTSPVTITQAISNFLSPQVTAIFLLGLLWPRTTEPGPPQVHLTPRRLLGPHGGLCPGHAEVCLVDRSELVSLKKVKILTTFTNHVTALIQDQYLELL